MSESINNREYRKKVITDILRQLHEGKTVEEVKEQFDNAFSGVSASEISEAEQALIAEGLPVSEVQNLCDVHASVFKGSIEEIHQAEDKTKISGHPTAVVKQENREFESMIQNMKQHLNELKNPEGLAYVKEQLDRLSQVDIHYSRKENLFFPYLEKYGITAPPKVMWGVDDEIRQQLKDVKAALNNDATDGNERKALLEALLEKVTEMIFKEENILLPMLLDILTEDEWKKIADESKEIGFVVEPVTKWEPSPEAKEVVKEERKELGVINLPTGVFRTEELTAMLDTLPFDITFVDKDDVVKYFSQSAERVFPRTKAIIGRNVTNCHPPASVHVVEQIVSDFKSGKKTHEDFWINMGDKFILIRYYAVHSPQGEYLGVVEVTQDIKPIQVITGEKRLVSE